MAVYQSRICRRSVAIREYFLPALSGLFAIVEGLRPGVVRSEIVYIFY